MEYKIGDLVKVRELDPWDRIEDMDVTPGMASLSGCMGIVSDVDFDNTVKIIFEIENRLYNDFWWTFGMIEHANME